jgi:hypothetical protein
MSPCRPSCALILRLQVLRDRFVTGDWDAAAAAAPHQWLLTPTCVLLLLLLLLCSYTPSPHPQVLRDRFVTGDWDAAAVRSAARPAGDEGLSDEDEEGSDMEGACACRVVCLCAGSVF